jgi:hypothetical protein
LWEEVNNRKISDQNITRQHPLVHLIKVGLGHDKSLRNEESKEVMGLVFRKGKNLTILVEC